jgi:hypothetical protein
MPVTMRKIIGLENGQTENVIMKARVENIADIYRFMYLGILRISEIKLEETKNVLVQDFVSK